MLLMIDNYDSFTYNVVQYFGKLGQQVEVYRNDEITIEAIEAKKPAYLVISPGPCSPNEAGISVEAIRYFAGKLPILGVCLGHQSIAQAFGGNIVRANAVMHGKISPIYHANKGVFSGLPTPYNATRYHSLVIEKASLPAEFEVTAWTQVQPAQPGAEPLPSNLAQGDNSQMDSANQGQANTDQTNIHQTNIDEIMGIRHQSLPIEGVQFHPESILTEHGYELLENFLKL